MWAPTRRQLLAGSGAIIASSSLTNVTRAQSASMVPLRVGVVMPASTGLTKVKTSINDLIGDAGRQGSLVAEARIGDEALLDDIRLVLLMASAPSAESSQRAGQRLVATGDIDALVGGVGAGQTDVLGAIAEKAEIPFFNVGSPRDVLRRADCRRFTFHIEASAAMYLDAMVAWGAAQGYRRWFVVHENNADGEDLVRRGVTAVNRHGAGGEVVGAAPAIPLQPFYGPQINAARDADTDAFLVLLSDIDQIAFVAQQESVDFIVPTVLFPHPNTQTRDYMAAFREFTRGITQDYRFALWDTTLEARGAAEFNTRYITRWGDPTDPTAWSSFHAIRILFETVRAIGTTDGPAVVDYLENAGTEFDLLKGPGTSFRPWDHQLRQPLYLVKVDQDAVWDRTTPSSRVAIAEVAGELPDLGEQVVDPVALLDLFGDGPEGPNCSV